MMIKAMKYCDFEFGDISGRVFGNDDWVCHLSIGEQGIPTSIDRLNLNLVKTQFKAFFELEQYFAGERTIFTVTPFFLWGTDFQKKVWQKTSTIQFGHTESYSALAKRLGDANKSRAVGNALGKNPICIIIPCHRVVHTDNSIGGFTGGIDYKKKLLDHEGLSL
jgi:O-6-methylguanine DNA methyltransferase